MIICHYVPMYPNCPIGSRAQSKQAFRIPSNLLAVITIRRHFYGWL